MFIKSAPTFSLFKLKEIINYNFEELILLVAKMKKTASENRDFGRELIFSFSRSSGPGGQNVNKVNTRVELRFKIEDSNILSDEEKVLVLKKLQKKINHNGELVLVSQSERSQLKNKEKVLSKFNDLINLALMPVKKRIATAPTYASRENRIVEKKNKSEKKQNRRKDLDIQ
jgi:ribosome-associated protein